MSRTIHHCVNARGLTRNLRGLRKNVRTGLQDVGGQVVSACAVNKHFSLSPWRRDVGTELGNSRSNVVSLIVKKQEIGISDFHEALIYRFCDPIDSDAVVDQLQRRDSTVFRHLNLIEARGDSLQCLIFEAVCERQSRRGIPLVERCNQTQCSPSSAVITRPRFKYRLCASNHEIGIATGHSRNRPCRRRSCLSSRVRDVSRLARDKKCGNSETNHRCDRKRLPHNFAIREKWVPAVLIVIGHLALQRVMRRSWTKPSMVATSL